MNYEALGRYTEAKEKLPSLVEELSRCLKAVQNFAKDGETDVCRLSGYGRNPEPITVLAKIKKIEAQIDRAYKLYNETAALCDTINAYAADCGKEGINISHN